MATVTVEERVQRVVTLTLTEDEARTVAAGVMAIEWAGPHGKEASDVYNELESQGIDRFEADSYNGRAIVRLEK